MFDLGIPFGDHYSKYYDLIYSDKDYEHECSYLQQLFRLYAGRNIHKVLDVGCGTAGHAVPLANKGYFVYAVDVSESMLEIGRLKASRLRVDSNIVFQRSDVRKLKIGHDFDACICMFAVINYILGYEDLLKALDAIHGQLKDGGLLIFDFWNGPAVLTIQPSEKTKITNKEGVRLIRFAKPHLDPIRNINSTEYTTLIIEDGKIKDEFKETHTVRYYFPEELRYFLGLSGFQVLSIHPFLKPDSELTMHDWNATVVARRSR